MVGTGIVRAPYVAPLSANNGGGTREDGRGTSTTSWSCLSSGSRRREPEELAAAAYSACFSMALALCLGERHGSSYRLSVGAEVAINQESRIPVVEDVNLTVHWQLPGMDAISFRMLVEQATELCRTAGLFTGTDVVVATETDVA